jgi:hypothetical protein
VYGRFSSGLRVHVRIILKLLSFSLVMLKVIGSCYGRSVASTKRQEEEGDGAKGVSEEGMVDSIGRRVEEGSQHQQGDMTYHQERYGKVHGKKNVSVARRNR